MSKRIVLLVGHADRASFNFQIAQRYESAARAQGAQVARFDLAELDFDPIMRAGYRVPQPLEPDLMRVRDAIDAADHLVWVFPTYWAGPPAVVRGLVDRLFLPRWAFRFDKGKPFPIGLLKGRSSRVIATMDSPGWWYSFHYRRCLHRSFKTGTLEFCGLAPVSFTSIHNMLHLSDAKRSAWLDRIEKISTRDMCAQLPKKSLAPVAEQPRV